MGVVGAFSYFCSVGKGQGCVFRGFEPVDGFYSRSSTGSILVSGRVVLISE